MIKKGVFVRCPIDHEYPQDPRIFATGKVVSVNEFNETAHISFSDPFGYRKFFEYIPDEVKEAPIFALDHCHLFKGAQVMYEQKPAVVVEYKIREDEGFDYYIQDSDSKEYLCVNEEKLTASFFSGAADPVRQLVKYEFQNPCWYLGRQIVKDTMNILDNSIFGFKELAGCKIYLKAFQVNTIMRCLQTEKCRYMLADEVGLGKTIEACSILKIFLSNKAGKNILIVVPSALAAQWKTELLFKFGILEGVNENDHFLSIETIEELETADCNFKWDFVIVDEVHNCIRESEDYEKVHILSRNAENTILLSATPIQQRKEEYLKLLRLIQPSIYDDIDIEEFTELVNKQNHIAQLTHSLLDDIDSLRNELLPEIEEEDPHENEDVLDQLEELEETLNDLSDLIGDVTLNKMIAAIDTDKEDFGLYDMQVVISYVCDNYQIERSIIRGRRAILGVYPKEEDGEFAERRLVEITYALGDSVNYYEYEAYRTLKEWIVQNQGEIKSTEIEREIQPVLEAFFSSPWAYRARLKEIYGNNTSIPENVWKSADRWVEDEDEILQSMTEALDDVESHPSRLIKIVSYIETELLDKKVVVFTNHAETFDVYGKVLYDTFGDEVASFSTNMDRDEAEINIYRFQSDSTCKILLCDKSGGEGRNLQIADYVIHVDLPWNINTIEQRIGRLDRIGRDVQIPVISVVIHTIESYEDQLFNFWNEGLNVFGQSLSGLEIIMNDINHKIIDSIRTDFEFGLYRLVPELIKEAGQMRETVQREQIFDTAALRYRPLYNQLERLLSDYQFNENALFAQTMMSWASLAGFGTVHQNKDSGLVAFDENNFSIRSAQNSFLIPPSWDNYLNKKQNEIAIRVQRGLEEDKQKNILRNNRIIKGSFDRDIAIKNDYIHFYAPGDEIFDCITDNAMHSYKGMATAIAALSSVEWRGFIYTFSVEPNERLLLDEGISLYALGLFRQYLATSIQVIPVAFTAYADVPVKMVLSEHRRIAQTGYFDQNDTTEHLGRRGFGNGFLNIPKKYKCSNIDWFRSYFPEERWEKLVMQGSKIARKKAFEKFKRESNISEAKEMIDQILSTHEAKADYYGIQSDESMELMKKQYEIIYNSLCKPIIRMESACYMWLVKK
ncbi:hypothetical protein D3Z62_14345 [Lachnospiraceae bacterium]|nr:hypothetical protein [Lachnospiraceae bacterium]